MSILKNVVFFNVKTHMVSGSFKLEPVDLGLSEKDLPHKELATLGAMKIISPDELRALRRFDDEAERLLKENGTKTDFGFAVPRDSARKVLLAIKDIQKRFDASSEALSKNIQSKVIDWANHAKNLPYREQILANAYSPDQLKRKLYMTVTNMLASSVNDNPDDLLNEAFRNIETNMFDCLLRDIADEANSTLKSLMTRESENSPGISATTVTKYRDDVIPKLRKFAFVDPRVSALANRLSEMVARSDAARSQKEDKQRHVVGPEYDWLKSELGFFSDVEKMKAFRDNQSSGIGVFKTVVQQVPSAVATPTVVNPVSSPLPAPVTVPAQVTNQVPPPRPASRSSGFSFVRPR